MKTYTKEFALANIIQLTVGTNCPQGGDSGHGGRTTFEIKDLSSTDWDIKCETDQYGCKSLKVEFRGDHEAYNLLYALKYAAEVLER